MLTTAFTTLVGCRVPIQLASMGGGVTTPDLAIAVSHAGGLGMLQSADLRTLPARIEELEQARAAPFGVNFVVREGMGWGPADVEMVAGRARVVEFFWSDPDPALVELAHAGGALVSWQVGSGDEGARARDAGCDLIVAQGVEAGGHVRGTTALLPLLSDVLDRVGIPVLAAGGISTARSMAAVLAAGASGVRVGTRFLATNEAGAHPEYVSALLAADHEATVLTTAFGVGWPDAPHRVLRSALDAANALGEDVVGWVGDDATQEPLPRFSARTPSRDVSGTIGAMAMYAGQGVGNVIEKRPAAAVVRELAEGAERLLRSGPIVPAHE